MQIGLNMSLSGLRTLDPAASVRALFSNDEPGTWFEANDSTTLFTDVAGTTPVTTPGDAIALQLDKSQGLTLGPELADTSVVSVSAATGAVVGSQPVGLSASSFYEVVVTISNYVSGSIRLEFKSGQNTSYFNASETFTLTPGVSGNVQFRTLGTTDLDVAISVRELPGNHRTQATTAARPLYALHPVGGVRNLLQYTEEFNNAVWAAPSGNATVTPNATTAPNGTSTADQFTVGATTGDNRRSQSGISIPNGNTITVYGKANTANWLYVFVGNTTATAWFDLSAGTVGTSANSTASIEDVGDGWYRCRITNNSTTGNAVWIEVADGDSSSVGVVGQSLFIWGAQLEQGSTATNYQRVGSFLDVSEEGKARRGRLWYNGTSHFMQTGTITPGTDKVQVFSGLRKLSDATAIIFEHSANVNSNQGSFHLANIETATTHQFVSKGTVTQTAKPISGANAPTTNILTALGDISGDSAILRIDGIQGAINTGDQGTGNYLAHPIYFGARAGTSLFYNGYEDTSIIRFGPNLDDTTISKVESYVASKTPEPTL